MYLVDTCGWIEWLIDGKLAQQFGHYLKNPSNLIVPTIVQFELYKWLCREKDEAIALEIIGITEQAQTIPLDTTIALYAADISKQHDLAMADAIIYATGQQNKAVLITMDSHFKKLPQVEFFIKN